MALYALIVSGLVHDLSPDASAWPRDHFDVRDVSGVAGISRGWLANADGTFSPPPVVLPSAADLVAYANGRQWQLATGGYAATIKGQAVPFSTSESALGLMDGKVMRLAQPNAPASVNWQVGPTSFVSIAADDFAHAATLVSDFVQATFDALPAIFSSIASGSIKTKADIDAAAWPAASGTLS